MLHVVTTGAYYPPVVTTWKIFTTEAFYLTTGTLCSGDDTIDNITLKMDLLSRGNWISSSYSTDGRNLRTIVITVSRTILAEYCVSAKSSVFLLGLILLHNTRIFGILDQIGDHFGGVDDDIYKSLIVMFSVDEDENLDKKKTGRKYKRWHRNLVLFQYWQILVSSDILALNWDWNTTSLYSIHLHI